MNSINSILQLKALIISIKAEATAIQQTIKYRTTEQSQNKCSCLACSPKNLEIDKILKKEQDNDYYANLNKSLKKPNPIDDKYADTIKKLKNRDKEVRTHEAAHLAAAGELALSGAHFIYQRGPDGKFYAIGGSVSIDTSPVPSDPEASIQKAHRIRLAALAPAEPSAQDQKVAKLATQMAQKAEMKIMEKQMEEQNDHQEANQNHNEENYKSNLTDINHPLESITVKNITPKNQLNFEKDALLNMQRFYISLISNNSMIAKHKFSIYV